MSGFDLSRSRQQISKTEAVSSHGMVTAMHPLAAEAGVEILRDGGNAADAAVATALAIGVAEPFMSGLGGAAYAVVYEARRDETTCFDGSAVAPREAAEQMFALAHDDQRTTGLYGWHATRDDASETGPRSVVVPGALKALSALHDACGSKPWAELFTPAIRLAEDGFPVDEYFFVQTAAAASRLRPFAETTSIFYHSDGTAKVPSLHGTPPEILRQGDLARTLRLVADEGPDVFYNGPIAKDIVASVRDGGGVLSAEDLESYDARRLEPLWRRYRDAHVAFLPENSGGPTVAFALALLNAFDLENLSHDSAKRLHLVAEALRLSFTDRFRFLGDPTHTPVPMEGLFSGSYIRERAALISAEGPRPESLPEGDPWRHQGLSDRPTRGTGDASSQHTTHLNAVDRDGNMVALTATLGARFGSGVTVPGRGIVLNNGFMWFDPEAGHTSSIAPGKRALHAAAPCLVFKDGAPFATLGAPGARKIMSAVLQVLLSLVDRGAGIQDAVSAPRLHCEGRPGLLVDDRFPPGCHDALREMGHTVASVHESFLSSYFGRPSGIVRRPRTKELRGGVEPYRAAVAMGY